MSPPAKIKVWVCKEPNCDYWRQDKMSGRHQTSNPENWRGPLVSHELREAEYIYEA